MIDRVESRFRINKDQMRFASSISLLILSLQSSAFILQFQYLGFRSNRGSKTILCLMQGLNSALGFKIIKSFLYYYFQYLKENGGSTYRPQLINRIKFSVSLIFKNKKIFCCGVNSRKVAISEPKIEQACQVTRDGQLKKVN